MNRMPAPQAIISAKLGESSDLNASDPYAEGELPRHADVQPLTLRTLIKLDQNSMIMAYEGVATKVEALAPFFSLLVSLGPIIFTYLAIKDGLEGKIWEDEVWIIILGLIFMWGLAIPCIIYAIKISLFNRYSDLHFNRKTRKIYTKQNKDLFEMDWANVRPYATRGFGPIQVGAPAVMSLQLVEYFPENPSEWRTRITVEGMLPNREGCQQVWELIRRYMEDPPETMPPQVVVPARSWSSALLEFGPLAESQGTTHEFFVRLRRTGWFPFNDLLSMFQPIIWLIFWPAPISEILYARFRRPAKLPTLWLASEVPPVGEPNPYRISTLDPAERSGRRRAVWVVALVCTACCLLSMTVWGVLIWGLYFSK